MNSALALTLETVPDAMLIVDAGGRVVGVNEHAERLFGWPRDELVGSSMDVLVPERHRQAHATHRGRYLAEPRARPMGAGLDLQAARKDGSEFACEISLAPVHIDGQSLVMVAVRDIGDRKRVEAKFRRFLDAAPDAIVIVDRQGAIALVNSQTERLFGYTRDQLLGEPVELLMAGRYHERHARHREHFFGAPVVRSMGTGRELFGRRRDGTEFPVEISLSPIETDEGPLVASAIRDITSRREVEAVLRRAHDELEAKTAQLEAANRELEAFSYSVAHDLRAPLRGVMGFAQILAAEHGAALGPDARECLDEIQQSGRKMGALIDALLALSRVTRSPLVPERVDLGALARSVLAELAHAEPGREVELMLADGLEVMLDPRLARLLVENLVGNAWKFTRNVARARIEIGVETQGGAPVWFVRDNGAGFDMTYADKLFVPFQRLHGALDYPGTGIGLATVQRILSRHGGRIWAHAEVGRGATFRFTVLSRGGAEP
ncbi:MAG: PAS domain S-box protein [Deltaproteobacteria bacterium]|nr:PAS domain S-box protein [Deltaproteobacteria bacterium]